MCLWPRLIKNRKYTKTKKNGGIIPPLPLVEIDGVLREDKRVLEVSVGCGKCIECRKMKSREWQVRLNEEIRSDNRGVFVTLTFSNEAIKELNKILEDRRTKNKIEGYERNNELAKIGVRRFLERWRKKYKKSVKHWFVTELGHKGTENIHIHGFIWCEKEDAKCIREIWKYGFVWLSTEKKGYVNEETAKYVTKYITKTDLKHKEYKSVILTSAGIGKGYLKRVDAYVNKFDGIDTIDTYRTSSGRKLGLPIYYRNKIYNDEEREELWRMKLDKDERYVLGKKIEEKFWWKAVKIGRDLNRQLGYGDDSVNWERKKYENERSNINFMKRLMNR